MSLQQLVKKKHVEQYLGTPYNKFANQLISQIDEAEITLLNPELRRKYDQQAGLFKKRRKKRQFDPNGVSSSVQRGGNRTVGEGSGVAREFAGIVAVLAIAFLGITAAGFWLPWEKLQPGNKNENPIIAKHEERDVKPENNKLSAENKSKMVAVSPKKIPEPESKKEKVDQSLNSIGMKFKLIPGGTFLMGAKNEKNNEKPVHQVILTKPYELGVYEVTQQQYEAVMGENPSTFKGADRPVEMVNWDEALDFCLKLSGLPAEKAAGNVYRLPTEAEWEYACRAGTRTKFSFGDEDSLLKDYGWYYKNSGRKTNAVGKKKPNAWGIYDMHGNVYEWCSDYYSKTYALSAMTDPTGPTTGTGRVVRGGCYSNTAEYCSAGFRFNPTPDTRQNKLGFRVVRSSINVSSESKK